MESEITPFGSNRQALITFYEGLTMYKLPETGEKEPVVMQGACKKGLVLVLPAALESYQPATREMFGKILTAQGLGSEDIGVVVAGSKPAFSYHDIVQQLQPKALILYGVAPAALGLALSPYDFYHEAEVKMLYADDLDTLAANQALKTKLWGLLKQHFIFG